MEVWLHLLRTKIFKLTYVVIICAKNFQYLLIFKILSWQS